MTDNAYHTFLIKPKKRNKSVFTRRFQLQLYFKDHTYMIQSPIHNKSTSVNPQTVQDNTKGKDNIKM